MKVKPFYCIDLTTDKKNTQPNGAELLVATPSSAMAQSLSNSTEKAKETVERSKLPLPLRIIQWVCGFAAAIIILSLLKSMVGSDAVSLETAYQNAGWLFWVAGICLPIWVILKLISSRRQKKVLDTEETTQTFSNLANSLRAVDADLDVPANAQDVDLLSFFYKQKGDGFKIRTKALQIAPYLNPVFGVFSDSEYLYIANTEGKYAIPLDSIEAIRTVKKRTMMIGWNKEERCNKGIYKPFKMVCDNYGRVSCKCHYIMECRCGGTLWGVYIPCYELPVFESLTGKKAQ